MNTKRIRTYVSTGFLVVVSSLMLVGCASLIGSGTTETQQHTFQVGENPTVIVRGFNGSVELENGDAGVVEVQADITMPEKVSYSATVSANTVTVVAEKIGSWSSTERAPGAKIRVILPAVSNINARTSNGHVTVNGVSGIVDLKSSNGRITMSDVEGRFTADTSNGKIEFSGSLNGEAHNSFTTLNGSIEVTFNDEPNVQLDAKTSNGKIVSDRPIMATTAERSRLVGKYGTGSTTLQLSTSNGSINIH